MSESPFDLGEYLKGGRGTIDLEEQRIDFILRPRPKDVSFLSIRAPLHVRGGLRNPDIEPDMSAVVRGGAAVLLGVLALPAAIIPLIETGPGKDSDCGALISQVEKRAGPIPEASGRP